MEGSPELDSHIQDRRRLNERLENDPEFREKYTAEQKHKADLAEAAALISTLQDGEDDSGLMFNDLGKDNVRDMCEKMPTPIEEEMTPAKVASTMNAVLGKLRELNVNISIDTVNIYFK